MCPGRLCTGWLATAGSLRRAARRGRRPAPDRRGRVRGMAAAAHRREGVIVSADEAARSAEEGPTRRSRPRSRRPRRPETPPANGSGPRQPSRIRIGTCFASSPATSRPPSCGSGHNETDGVTSSSSRRSRSSSSNGAQQLLDEIANLNLELQNEPAQHTASLASWLEGGKEGDRPVSRAPELESRRSPGGMPGSCSRGAAWAGRSRRQSLPPESVERASRRRGVSRARRSALRPTRVLEGGGGVSAGGNEGAYS